MMLCIHRTDLVMNVVHRVCDERWLSVTGVFVGLLAKPTYASSAHKVNGILGQGARLRMRCCSSSSDLRLHVCLFLARVFV